MSGTIVIPAYNEASVVDATLACVLLQRIRGWRVIVSANGCQDDTAARARGHDAAFTRAGAELLVLEHSGRSKTCAINRADGLAGPGPRVYLDADAMLGRGALELLVGALVGGHRDGAAGVHLAAPQMVLTRMNTMLARQYWRVWRVSNRPDREAVWSGCLAVSEAGRSRWKEFPEIIADDAFVISQFAPSERRVVAGASVELHPPTRLGEIVRVRARWHAGHVELVQRGLAGPHPLPAARLNRLMRDPVSLLGLPAYMMVRSLARRQGRRQAGVGSAMWYRSTSDRAP